MSITNYFKGVIHYNREKAKNEDFYDAYLKYRDPLLGWPFSVKKPGEPFAYDKSGSRPVPAFPNPGGACVSLYGDSFVYGQDVNDEDAWGNRLANLLGRRVANYGVAGYATDQAFLRFQRNRDDEARVVALGIFSHDILRNLTQDSWFIGTSNEAFYGFKPRFTLKNGELALIPMPCIDKSDLQEYLKNPRKWIPYEWFLPDTKDGPVTFKFPYSVSLLKTLTHHKFLDQLMRRPSDLDLYKIDDQSGAMPLVMEITRAFAKLARDRGKTPLVLLFPNPRDIGYYRKTGVNLFQPLSEYLANSGVSYIDFLTETNNRYKDNYCEVFSKKSWGFCGGHYNKEGNEMVAMAVYDWLKKKDFDCVTASRK